MLNYILIFIFFIAKSFWSCRATVETYVTSVPYVWDEDHLEGRYQLLIIISGQATVVTQSGNSINIKKEEALFLPLAMERYIIENIGDNQLICLSATPN